jgi:hypothetical protein
VTDVVEAVRTAHACYHEQEAHPYADDSQAAVLCELVHSMLARCDTADVATILDNVRHWMVQDAVQMTDEELRLRLRFDRLDEKRAGIARAEAERIKTAREEAVMAIREVRARIKDPDTTARIRKRLKAHLRKLKATRDAPPALSALEGEARRRGVEA